MHYFKFNIGDYHKKAGRLSMLEHGAYTLLIHACYDRERFPTEDEALDWCWARTDEEVQAVKFVLRKFFEEQDGRFYQKRIEDEITNFHEKSEKNREIALKREAARRTKREEKNTKRDESSTKREPNAHEAPPNHKPITKNHYKFTPPSVKEVREYCQERSNGVDPQTFVDHYEANGWMRGKTKVKDWKACVRTWEKNNKPQQRIEWE
jgi:uncharacterized protein YdaU (DUF1376 family)